jgi:hypothetical protein
MSESVKSGGALFIVDNSDEAWKGLKYLHDWTDIASAFDIATGYFEIGALLALDGKMAEARKGSYLDGQRSFPTHPAGVARWSARANHRVPYHCDLTLLGLGDNTPT